MKAAKVFADASVVALLPDAMLPRQHLDAALVHEAYQLLKDEKQVTFHQANRDGCADGGEDAEAGRIGDGLFLALLLLLGLPLLIVAAGWLLRMMHRAGWDSRRPYGWCQRRCLR